MNIFLNFKIKINNNLYIKDPTSSELGRKIISTSVDMINEIGFENFTFKKIGKKIDSTEASIYRYFESKNQLLLYITSWYWGWMDYKLAIETINIESAELRLEKAINLITRLSSDDFEIDGIEIKKLNQIAISESSKSFLTKDVDKSNQVGAYSNYKDFVGSIVKIIKEINPIYKYPNMLVSTIIEGAHLQMYFAEHLPRLTNKQKSKDYIPFFFNKLAIQSIKSE